VEHWEADNPKADPVQTKLDVLTGVIVVLALALVLTWALLWLAYDSNSARLDIIEQATGIVR
jgi:hypothetical protein